MGYKFIKIKNPDNKFDLSDITFEIEQEELTLSDLISEIEDFIKACGFDFDGHLNIVEEE